jgi:hypothetical protein
MGRVIAERQTDMAEAQLITRATHGDSLADILERVLHTGVVIAGDIRIKLCDIELLTIQLRLLVCSVEKARELGISWWWQNTESLPAQHPPHLPHAPAQGPHTNQPQPAVDERGRLPSDETISAEDYREFCEFRRFRDGMRTEHQRTAEQGPQ